MSPIHVRRAKLDDTQAISALFRSRVSVWQRLKADGRVEDLPYEALTIYERWSHGGPAYSGAWMNVETGAIFLSHLLRGFGLPLVAVVDGIVQAYAEAYPGSEPAPFGNHLHLAHLVTTSQNEALAAALIEALTLHARELGCERLTVAVSSYDTQAAAFYKHFRMQPLSRARRYTLPAQTGQSFYKATEHRSSDPAQIKGWPMSIGRIESASQHWATLWPRLWEAVDEIAAETVYRLRFNAAGQDSFLCCQAHRYDPRSADFYCWSPKPLTPQFLTALRDWAHRENFRTMVLTMPETLVNLLGAEAEATPYQQEILALDV